MKKTVIFMLILAGMASNSFANERMDIRGMTANTLMRSLDVNQEVDYSTGQNIKRIHGVVRCESLLIEGRGRGRRINREGNANCVIRRNLGQNQMRDLYESVLIPEEGRRGYGNSFVKIVGPELILRKVTDLRHGLTTYSIGEGRMNPIPTPGRNSVTVRGNNAAEIYRSLDNLNETSDVFGREIVSTKSAGTLTCTKTQNLARRHLEPAFECTMRSHR